MGGGDKQLTTVGRDVAEILALAAEGDALAEAALDVIALQIGAGAPARLTVVHLKNLIDVGILLGTLFRAGEDEVVLGGADGIALTGDVISPAGALSSKRVHLIEHALVALPLFVDISDGARHPGLVAIEVAQQSQVLHLAQLIGPQALATTLGGLIAHDDELAIGRERDATNTFAIGEVVEHILVTGEG